jgi:hypothetical protein
MSKKKGQTTIHKTLRSKLNIEQYELHYVIPGGHQTHNIGVESRKTLVRNQRLQR